MRMLMLPSHFPALLQLLCAVAVCSALPSIPSSAMYYARELFVKRGPLGECNTQQQLRTSHPARNSVSNCFC